MGALNGGVRPAAGRSGGIVLAVLVPATALAVDPGGWFPYGPSKWLALVALLPLGAASVLRGGAARLGRPITGPLVLLLGVLAAAATFGLDPLYAWTGTPERMFGWLTWALCGLALVAGASLDVERDGRWLALGVVAAGTGVGGLAVGEALGWRPGPIGLGGARLTGTYGSAAYLGAAAALLGPMVVGVALDRGADRRLRGLAVIGAVGLAVALVGSGTRSAWLGLVVGVALLGWSRRGDHRGRRGSVAAGAALAAVLGAVLIVATPVGGRLWSLGDPDAAGGRGRLDEWRIAVRVLADHPVLGVGPEGYRIAFGSEADDAYERAHGRDPLPDRAHSAPLDIALAGGPLALAAWAGLVVGVGRRLGPVLGRGRPALAGTVVGLVAYEVGQLFLFPVAEIDPIAWLLAGAALAANASGGSSSSPLSPAPAGRARRRVPGVVLGALLLAGAAATVVAGAGVAADRRAARAVDLLALGDGPGAARAASGAAALRPDVIRYRLLEARAQVVAGEGTVAALADLERAAAISPRDPIVRLERVRTLVDRAAATRVPAHAAAARRAAGALVEADRSRAEAWRLLGRSEALDGDLATAVASLDRAADLAPRDPAPLLDLAEVELSLGRRREARRAVDRALVLDPADPRARAAAAEIAGLVGGR